MPRLARYSAGGPTARIMTGTTLSSEGLDARRKRALFRAWHRGTREMDLVFGRFADAELTGLDDADLAEFETLLSRQDTDLFKWVTGAAAILAEHDTPLFRRIRSYGSSW